MKKFYVLLGIVLCLPFVLFGCGKSEKLNLNEYRIEATYDEAAHTLSATQSVKYFNNFDNPLTEICFFLYPNAFSQSNVAVSSAYTQRAYPNGQSYGHIDIEKVTENGKEVTHEVSEAGNILTVTLSKEIFPKECVEIEMEWVLTLANIRHRLGFCDKTVNFGNFFPIACVYENGFVKNEFSPNGDPFYSDVANFDVTVTVPAQYVLASTGKVVNETENDGMKTHHMKASKVRDFCFSISKDFQTISKNVDGTTVTYYFYDDENANHHLDISAQAIETFNDMFGKYVYDTLAVVKAGFCFGGMEYPNLVLIADDLPDSQTEDYVIVHEIAHQWWYGMVGNNEFENAWVDEGLTEFSTALFFEKHSQYGFDYDVVMENALQSYQHFVEIYTDIKGSVDESMNRKLTEFETEPEYVNCTYVKGMLLFDGLRSSMSDRKFFKCLSSYFEKYAFKNSSAEKLIESFCDSAGRRLEKYFDSWTSGKVKLGA